jgi:hypothetical protein
VAYLSVTEERSVSLAVCLMGLIAWVMEVADDVYMVLAARTLPWKIGSWSRSSGELCRTCGGGGRGRRRLGLLGGSSWLALWVGGEEVKTLLV